MLRSIKSAQRKVRILSFKVASGDLAGSLDEKQATIATRTVTFNQAFAEVPQVIASSDDGDVVKSAVTASGFTVSEDCDVLVIGHDITSNY